MRKILFIISILLIFVLYSCQITPPAGDDSTNETTTEETTEETTEGITVLACPDLSQSSLQSLEEYNAFLYHCHLADDFVSLELLPDFGKFKGFFVYYDTLGSLKYDGDNHMYRYMFHSTTYSDGSMDDGLDLTITHLPSALKQADTLEPALSTNMIHYSGTGNGDGCFTIGSVVGYTYYYGLLQEIYWYVDGIRFGLRSAPNYEAGFEMFNKDETEFDFVRDLLNAETAEAAIARFAAKLKGEEETP